MYFRRWLKFLWAHTGKSSLIIIYGSKEHKEGPERASSRGGLKHRINTGKNRERRVNRKVEPIC